MRRVHPSRPAPVWAERQLVAAPDERRKLLAVLTAAAVGSLAVVIGLVMAGYYSVIATPTDTTVDPKTRNGGDPRAEVAGRELPEVDESAARPGPLTSKRFAQIRLPAATRLGSVGVSTGFPRTPHGALAQLASIDQRVLQSASVATAQQVIRAWAVPGGPTPESWSGVRAVAALLGSAGVTDDDTNALTVSASPEMGLIKGTVGPDFVVACVDFVVTATLTKRASTAAADCQRMVWVDGRWRIGAGPEPAPAPSVWPDTEEALNVGYRVLRDE
jgi:hypothetical protein